MVSLSHLGGCTWQKHNDVLCVHTLYTQRTRMRARTHKPARMWVVFFLNFWLHLTACRTLVPKPGIKPAPRALEGRLLTLGCRGSHRGYDSLGTPAEHR